MKLYENTKYLDDIKYVVSLDLPWDKMKDSSIMISGASGMIGSFLVDVIMYRNIHYGMNCKVYALGRNQEKINNRFSIYLEDQCFDFVKFDVSDKRGLATPEIFNVDYIVHAASNTHPVAYSTDPIGTITANVIGLQNLLEYAAEKGTKRFMFASSNEIYGENRGDKEYFDEQYCGYIDCNTLRAGYPESKRTGEALCQAYIKQKGLDIVISRFTRSFGPTMLLSDTKAVSQFIKKAINNEDIVLKSDGSQLYSYTYVVDAVAGALTVLLKGECGEAYNISDKSCDITLKELSQFIAEYTGNKVIFEIPDATERAGYSTATKALLDSSKLNMLGWSAKYDIKSGIERTIDIFKTL